jgi:hypothetical protein
LEISNINNSNINFNLDNSYLNDIIVSNYNLIDEEYNELITLEKMLMSEKVKIDDEIKSMGACHRQNISSDIDEGYKSNSSCFSDNVSTPSFIKKVKKLDNKIASVTINLINKDEKKLKCFNKTKNKNK